MAKVRGVEQDKKENLQNETQQQIRAMLLRVNVTAHKLWFRFGLRLLSCVS